MKYVTVFFLLTALTCLSASAAWNFGPGGPSHSSGGGGGGGGRSSGIRLRLLGDLKFQRATMMSKNDFVEKRSLNGVGAEAIAGISIGTFILGGGASYTKFFQATDKKDVGDTDTSGDLTAFQGVAGFGFWKFCLLGRYFFKADYKLSQKTEAGESAVYSKPSGSYGLSLMYRPGGRSFWSLDYTNMNFSEMKLGGEKYSLKNSDDKINLNSFGLSYGFMY